MFSRFLIFLLKKIRGSKMDTGQVIINVQAQPVSFVPNADGLKIYSIDVTEGQGFVLGIPYQSGSAPFSASLTDAPAWAAADVDAPGFVTIRGTVPADQPEGAVTFTATITDAKGNAAAVDVSIPVVKP
jgi:hypothetical protein